MGYAFIFAGQGCQSVGMGREFYDNVPAAKELLQNASDSLKIDFKNLLFEPNDNLNISEFTQPAIVLNSLMTYLALKQRVDIKPKFSLGHSLGEFSALAVCGAFDFIDVLRLVNLRGKFMSNACAGKDAGMMVVLGLDDDKVKSICENARLNNKQIYAANFNCDGQIVVAGVKSDLANCEESFKQAGAKRTMILNMSVASHCPMLQTASDELFVQLQSVLRDKFLPVISNVTAKSYDSKDDALQLLKQQLVKPVLYRQSVENIADDVSCFIEFGSAVLKGINKKITQKPTFSIVDMSSLDEIAKKMEI